MSSDGLGVAGEPERVPLPGQHVPVGLARLGATVIERLPRAPITRDQLKMLTEAGDNVCDNGPALEAYDVDLVGLDDQIRRAA